MAKIVLAGFSNSGKTTSLRFLPPESTMIINVNVNKDPSFPGFKKKFEKFHAVEVKDKDGKTVMRADGKPKKKYVGNYYKSDDYNKISTVIRLVGKNPRFKYLVIDDINFLMGADIMDKITDKSYDKFSGFAKNYTGIIDQVKALRDDLDVVIVSHVMKEEFNDGTVKTRMMSVVKSIDKYKPLDAQFDYIIYAEYLVDDITGNIRYVYRTRKEGDDSCRTVYGVFKDKYIEPNVLKVLQRIHAFEDGDEEPEYPDDDEVSEQPAKEETKKEPEKPAEEHPADDDEI